MLILKSHCEEWSDEAISLSGRSRDKDCFAALAMTVLYWLAETLLGRDALLPV